MTLLLIGLCCGLVLGVINGAVVALAVGCVVMIRGSGEGGTA